ncbi:MAG: hypothetical protein LBS28_00315 [Streptococcaceae bacterium]|jgi:hypothetical protein|nr:hypothetical protein [Streptococcaceae bacterium]
MLNIITAAGNEENLVGFFDAMISVNPQVVPAGTLATTWNAFSAIARNCQGMFFGSSEPAVDQEMSNICTVGVVNRVLVNAANSQASWDAIRDEIVRHQRMVIVTFINPANPEDAHCCVAFAADNDVGAEALYLYNPWGNWFNVMGDNPGMTHNMAAMGSPAKHWDIYQYITFNY